LLIPTPQSTLGVTLIERGTQLQNFRSAETHIHYYAFDILVVRGRELLLNVCAALVSSAQHA
jgi:hypothetical protein